MVCRLQPDSFQHSAGRVSLLPASCCSAHLRCWVRCDAGITRRGTKVPAAACILLSTLQTFQRNHMKFDLSAMLASPGLARVGMMVAAMLALVQDPECRGPQVATRPEGVWLLTGVLGSPAGLYAPVLRSITRPRLCCDCCTASGASAARRAASQASVAARAGGLQLSRKTSSSQNGLHWLSSSLTSCAVCPHS